MKMKKKKKKTCLVQNIYQFVRAYNNSFILYQLTLHIFSLTSALYSVYYHFNPSTYIMFFRDEPVSEKNMVRFIAFALGLYILYALRNFMTVTTFYCFLYRDAGVMTPCFFFPLVLIMIW